MIPTDDLPHIIMGACLEVHRELGPGWDESAYRAALAREFRIREIFFHATYPLSFTYKGETIPTESTADFLVEGTTLLMIHAVDALLPIHKARLTSFLRLSGHDSGFLINFNVSELRDGVKRVVIRRENPPPHS